MSLSSLKFALFGNKYQTQKSTELQRVLDILREAGVRLAVDREYGEFISANGSICLDGIETFDSDDFSADFVISMGGDGTFLMAANRVGSKQIPIIGINMGRLGFLADINSNDIDTELGVHVVGVVEHLIFGAALPDGDVLFLAFGVLGLDFLCEVEDAGVAALGDLVFELEGEVLELVGEDEVAAAFYLGFAGAGAFEVDGAVFNIPAGGGFGHAVAAPTLEGLAVEEGDVAVGIGGGQFCLFVLDDGELGHAGLGGGVGATLAGAATAGAGAAVLLAARHHEQAGGSYNK